MSESRVISEWQSNVFRELQFGGKGQEKTRENNFTIILQIWIFQFVSSHNTDDEQLRWQQKADATLSHPPFASYIQLPALWSQGACVSSLLKLANSRILHNIVVIANPLVIVKTVLDLTKTCSPPARSLVYLSLSSYRNIHRNFFDEIKSTFLSYSNIFFRIIIVRLAPWKIRDAGKNKRERREFNLLL